MPQSLHILLVDDSPDHRLLLRRLLHDAFPDISLTEVGSAAALDAALASAIPDLVITDYRLRWSDGLDVLRAVKAADRLCPVLMVTNTGSEEVAAAAMRAGLDDYLLKRPASLERLPAAVTAALERAAERRRIAALEAEREQAVARMQQAVEEKEASLALLELLLQRAPVGLAFFDQELRYQRINETLAATNGRPVEEHLGRTLRDILPDLAPVAEPLLAQVLTRGEALTDVEVVEPRADGTQRVWQASYYPVRTNGGPAFGVGVVATDVTGQRAAEAALRASDMRFRLIAESIRDAFWISNPRAGQVLYVSPAFTQIWGRSFADLQAQGLSWNDAVHPDDRDEVMASLARIAEGGYDEIYRVVRPDGSIRWVRDRGFPVTNDQGAMVYAVGVVEDITERRDLEARLRELRADLETFAETMPISVMVSDDPGCTHITGNQAASRLLRTPPNANLSKTAPTPETPIPFAVLRDGLVLGPDELPMQQVGRTGHPLYDDELEIRFVDGEVKYIAGYVSPRFDAVGRVRGVIGAYVDLSERRRVEMLQRLFAQLSADLVSSLDYDERLRRVARLTVPELADYSVLDVIEPDGAIVRAAVAHADPARTGLIQQMLRYPPDPRIDAGVPAVLRTGVPQLLVNVPPDLLPAAAQDTEHLAVLRALGPRSSVVMPLVARDTTIGALSLIMAESGRRYAEAELPTLQEFAARVALAIDHTHLFQQQTKARQIAEHALSRLSLLQRITAALMELLTPRQVAERILAMSLPAVGAANGWVVGVDADQAHLSVLDAAGFPPALVEQWHHIPLETAAPVAEAIRTGVPIWVESLEERWARYPAAAASDQSGGTWAAIPLLIEGRPVGGLGLGFPAFGPVPEEDRALLLTLAQQCAQALRRAQLYEGERAARARLEQTSARLQRLQQITGALSAALRQEDVANVFATQALPAAGAQGGGVLMLSPDRHEVIVLGAAGFDGDQFAPWRRFPVERGTPAAEILRTGAPLFLASAQEYQERFPDAAPAVVAQGYAAYAGFPLHYEGRVIGAMTFNFATPRDFRADDQQFMAALAEQCAQALERARLYEAEQAARTVLEQTSTHLASLQAATAAFSRALTAEDVARVVVEQGLSVLGAVAGAVARLAPTGTELELVQAAGYAPRLLEAYRRFPLSAPLPLADAARENAPIWIESRAAWAARYPELYAHLPPERAAAAVLPLQLDTRVIGALGLTFAAARTFSPHERALLAALAQQCAQALERARLYEAEQAARASAQDAVELRDAFFSVATHELRTPLTGLLGQAQLLQRRLSRNEPPTERDHRAISIIIGQAQRLDRQIADLLDVSRLAQGQLTVERAPLDLCVLAQRVVEGLQPTLERHRVVCEDDGLPLIVLADEARFEQVLQNLIQNGIKYSPQGGTVTMRLRHVDSQVEVEVEDQGVGIPAEALPHLFQRFYRATHDGARGISGLGVGLYVVREIVSLHDGTVEVASTLGQGSRFTVRLPLLHTALAPHEVSP